MLLLQEGFVGCDDRTMMTVTMGASKLRNAETYAKNERLRCWRNRQVEPKVKVDIFCITFEKVYKEYVILFR